MARVERTETRERSYQAGGRQEITDMHLLCWLLVYPASSAQDLAAAFDLHPATVYRHLAPMLAAGWLQRITGSGRDSRFLLTSHGTGLLAQTIQKDADRLRQTWQRGKNTPARLLPRLLTIDRLHTFTRRLFQYAPLALARQGHPVVVRWHLVRDWQARLEVTSKRHISIQALLAWTVTGSQRDASQLWATEKKDPAEERWHVALLLLESGLCDASLITTRLRTVLCYRATLQHERGLEAIPFAPILVLVESERQAEVWRRAVQQAAQREDAEPLTGAIAVLSEQENSWQWAWHDLAVGAHLRLAARLSSQAVSALPEGVLTHLMAVQDLMEACNRSDEATTRLAEQKMSRVKGAKGQTRYPVVLLAPSPRQQGILTRLLRTPYMTADELAAVLPRIPDGKPLAPASTERLLRELARQHLVERELVAQGQTALWRWYLSESGLRQVATMHNVSLRYVQRLAARDRFLLHRQGTHLAGVYGVVAAFHRTAQASQCAFTIAWWECGRGAERTYHYHGVQRNLRPDAELELVRYQNQTPGRIRLWIEWDSGTMNQRDLSRKLAAYADYWDSRAWVVEGLTALPRLLFIVPHSEQERRVRQACQEKLAAVRLRVLVTTAAHLEAVTPFGCIWRPLWPNLTESEQPKRRTLFE